VKPEIDPLPGVFFKGLIGSNASARLDRPLEVDAAIALVAVGEGVNEVGDELLVVDEVVDLIDGRRWGLMSRVGVCCKEPDRLML